MPTQTSRDYFKSIKIIFFSLLGAQTMFALVTLYLNLASTPLSESSNSVKNIFLIIAAVLALNGLVTGNIIYKSRLRKFTKNSNLKVKMGEYRTTLLIRLAMLEGSTIFSLVAYLMTADLLFLGFAGMTFAYFVFLNPSKETITLDLELSPTEKALIENPDEIIVEFDKSNSD